MRWSRWRATDSLRYKLWVWERRTEAYWFIGKISAIITHCLAEGMGGGALIDRGHSVSALSIERAKSFAILSIGKSIYIMNKIIPFFPAIFNAWLRPHSLLEEHQFGVPRVHYLLAIELVVDGGSIAQFPPRYLWVNVVVVSKAYFG